MRSLSIALLLAALSLALSGCATEAEIERIRAERALAAQQADKSLRTYLESDRSRHSKSLVHPETRDLDRALALDGEDFDLSLALWLFAKRYQDSRVDVDAGLKQIDDWRRELVTYSGRAF
ncbi:MAG: hypothetical protein KDB07_07185, partial [Planctomycetes bacterium]|nr:hypothetical protein [Planctomycetota bacterium]